jgi:hypothetical protein
MGFVVFWFFPLNIISFSGGISLFSVVFLGSIFVYLCIHLSLVCLFWACEFLEVSLAGWVIFSMCGTPLCGVTGRYNLFEC